MELQTRQIADFALRASYLDLTNADVDQLKRHLLDALGSLLSCLEKPTIEKLRKHIRGISRGGDCKVPHMQNVPLDRASQYYTALIRYPDFMDNYLGKEATCHPSDNLGPLLAMASYREISGRDFLLAMAISYQIECRLVNEIPVMKEGIDHTLFLSYSIISSAGRLLGLTRDQMANALAIAGCSVSPLATSRASYTYEWKGLASSQEAMVCIDCISQGQNGITGPLQIFEGPKGFKEVFNMKLDYDWSKETFELIRKCILKSYNAEVHTQSAIYAALQIKADKKFDVNKITKVRIQTFLTAYQITGSGSYGDRQDVETKEQADHSMFYVVAVALLDGEIYPEQLTPERIEQHDVQTLLKKIEVHTGFPLHKPLEVAGLLDPYTRAYPEKVMAHVTIELSNGEKLESEVSDYPGFHTNPLDWEQVIKKFRRLSSATTSKQRQDQLIEIVQNLENASSKSIIDIITS
jgi:2-methylcitrate dehydratase